MGVSDLVVTNVGVQSLAHPVLYLNPGLEVTALTGEQGENLSYTRESQAILLEKALQPGEEILLHLV